MIEAILNRLRGTGLIKSFGTIRIGEMKLWKINIPEIKIEIKLVWNHVYGLYLALIVGLLSMNVYAGLLTLVAYFIGESKGWGEWVGTLTKSEELTQADLLRNYKDNEGRGFPYIHKIANLITSETSAYDDLESKTTQYLKYAIVALALRGIYWWGLVYGVMAGFGLVNVVEAVVITLALGVGFPIACELGKRIGFEGKIGGVNFNRGWENQEVIYGFMQGIALWYVIFKNLI